MELPDEVLKAKEAYNEAYDKIKPLIKAQKKKYLGTKFEDCPPMIKEQFQFMVKQKDLQQIRERLTAQYGECPSTWAYWVAWYEKKSS